MPFPLMLALLLAFGFDPPADLGPIPRSALIPRLEEVAGGVALVGCVAVAVGLGVSRRRSRRGDSGAGLRRRYAWGTRAVEGLSLAIYAWMIHGVGWPWVVRVGLGLRGVILAEDVLILLPFLLMQLLGWWGLYPAERVLRPGWTAGPGRYLSLKARQSLGLILPVVLVFSVGQGVVERLWPRWAAGAWAQPVGVAVLAALVLVLSPVFVRLAWPTRPLPPGPLRDRLERLAKRLGFRCTDILVWDTGHALVNAGVTGALPWFRYVLLTDALVDFLDDYEIAAVFGHELGHIAHRHMLSFGGLLVGSLGVLAVVGGVIDEHLAAVPGLLALRSDGAVAMAIQAAAALLSFGLYFLLVFGHVSRRFERQADVFGCRAVSCGRAACPPHADVDRGPGPVPAPVALCPVGIRIFANALANVAALNGMEPEARSWRHGSIARRIAFLEGLEGRPEAERRFQLGVSRLRLALGLALLAALLLALATGEVGRLR
jgi:STE24 endopeptidase